MRAEVEGLTRTDKILMSIVILLGVFATGVQVGIRKGRELERAELETREEIRGDILFVRLLEKIIEKESGGKHHSDGMDGEHGICQFKEKTFYWMAELAGLENPDWKNEEQQIALLAWAVKNGWARHWTTFHKVVQDAKNNRQGRR